MFGRSSSRVSMRTGYGDLQDGEKWENAASSAVRFGWFYYPRGCSTAMVGEFRTKEQDGEDRDDGEDGEDSEDGEDGK